MSVPAPEWLSKRGGSLHGSIGTAAYAVFLGGEPQYLVEAIPAGGKYGCRVKQSNNGKRLEGPGTYATADDAVRGGLEELRKALGW